MERFAWCALLVATGLLPAQNSNPVATAESTAALLASLQQPEAQARVEALRHIANLPAADVVLAAVALTLGDADLAVRRAAVDTLLVWRKDLAPLRGELLEIVSVRAVAEPQVAGVGVQFGFAFAAGDPGRELPRLSDPDPSVRRKAVVAICKNGQRAAGYEEELLALLHDADADVRAAVAKNIGSIGWGDSIRDALVLAMKDSGAGVRRRAAESLGWGVSEPLVVTALRGALQDPDLDVRTQALRSLAKCGAFGVPAAADVTASLRDREPKVRVAALEAIRLPHLRTERAAAEAARLLDDEDRKVLLAALQTMAALQAAAAAAMPTIVALLEHPLVEVRRRAIEAMWAVLGEQVTGSAVLRSIETLRDIKREDGKAAAQLLRQFVDRARPTTR